MNVESRDAEKEDAQDGPKRGAPLGLLVVSGTQEVLQVGGLDLDLVFAAGAPGLDEFQNAFVGSSLSFEVPVPAGDQLIESPDTIDTKGNDAEEEVSREREPPVGFPAPVEAVVQA